MKESQRYEVHVTRRTGAVTTYPAMSQAEMEARVQMSYRNRLETVVYYTDLREPAGGVEKDSTGCWVWWYDNGTHGVAK